MHFQWNKKAYIDKFILFLCRNEGYNGMQILHLSTLAESDDSTAIVVCDRKGATSQGMV